jgi:serine/threonine-protein kinase
MFHPGGAREQLQTQHYAGPSPDGGPGADSRDVRCRLAAGSGPAFTDEMSHLLRRRLRLAILIVLAGFAFHYLRNLLPFGPAFDHRPLWLLFVGSEIAVLAAVSALLWSRRPLAPRTLRALEFTVFGLVAALFAWLQFDTYHDGALLRALRPGHEALVFRLVGVSAALRWFLLIVLYGTFIPNTGRRCAAVVAGLAALPVALTVAGSLFDPATSSYVLATLPETALLMATAAAIAVFGSHKIRELQKRAHEARRLGQYRLKEVLGFGGMGTVYLAEHVLLRRPCAIKVIRPDQAGDPKTLLRFVREVRATAALTHPNTVEVYDYGHAEDGTFYYVMEYLPGMNLEDMVERHGPLPPGRAVHLLRQVCRALSEAHGTGLIHRDVKPSNVIACRRGGVPDVAKLLDFGLVQTFDTGADSVKLTREGAFTGSPSFMSPEQALGRGQVDARSDIYSVGAAAHYLLTGKLPFDRTSAVEMLHAHALEPFAPGPEFNEAVPADLRRVIVRCLEKDPDRRYPDAVALEEALAACRGVDEWTAERAEEWWRQNGEGITEAAPPLTEEEPAAAFVPGITPGNQPRLSWPK